MPVTVNETRTAALYRRESDGSATPLRPASSAGAASYACAEPDAGFAGATMKEALDELFRRLALAESMPPEVARPRITSPEAGFAAAFEEPFALASTPFAARPRDEHVASEWRVRNTAETVLWSSGEDAAHLTGYPDLVVSERIMPELASSPGAAKGSVTLRIAVRHKGRNPAGEAWSDWSPEVRITAATKPVPEYVIYTTSGNGSRFTVPADVTELAVLVVPSGGCSSQRRGGVGGWAGAARVTVTPGEEIAVTLPTGNTYNPGAAFGTYVSCSNSGVVLDPAAVELWRCKTGNGGNAVAPTSGTTFLNNGGTGGGFRWKTDEDWTAFVLAGPGEDVPGNGGAASSSTSGSAGKSVGNGGAAYGGGAGGSGRTSPANVPGRGGVIVVIWGSLLA